VLPPNIPNNEGVFRAIEVVAPPGTIANGVLPAACAARGLTGFRMVDCAFGCLAMMLPDRVFAASDGGNTGISIGGYDADRKPFIYVDFTCGAWGAWSSKKGSPPATSLLWSIPRQPPLRAVSSLLRWLLRPTPPERTPCLDLPCAPARRFARRSRASRHTSCVPG
jgi:hypothetical protein